MHQTSLQAFAAWSPVGRDGARRRLHQAVAGEDVADGARRRHSMAEPLLEDGLQLLAAPRGVTFPLRDHELDQLGRRPVRDHLRRARLILQPGLAESSEPLFELVAGLPRDSVLAAQVAEALTAQQPLHQFFAQVHW